jgi:DNA/RNA endonuclease YhcR with UshA esterase domain
MTRQKHIDQTITVTGVIDEVHTSGRGNTFLNLGGKYPKQTFTGVIFSQNTSEFPNASSFEGKTVEISGAVQLYHDKSEIILQVGFSAKSRINRIIPEVPGIARAPGEVSVGRSK